MLPKTERSHWEGTLACPHDLWDRLGARLGICPWVVTGGRAGRPRMAPLVTVRTHPALGRVRISQQCPVTLRRGTQRKCPKGRKALRGRQLQRKRQEGRVGRYPTPTTSPMSTALPVTPPSSGTALLGGTHPTRPPDDRLGRRSGKMKSEPFYCVINSLLNNNSTKY